MSQPSVPLLYRHILRAARRFPSVKREGIIQEIKTEFHANKVRQLQLKPNRDMPRPLGGVVVL